MKRTLLAYAALLAPLLTAKHPGVIGTPTIAISLSTQVDLATLQKVYQGKFETYPLTRITASDAAVCDILTYGLSTRTSFFGIRKTFYLSDPWVIAGSCENVPPDILDMILKSIEYDKYGVALPPTENDRDTLEHRMRTATANLDNWGTFNEAAARYRFFLSSQLAAIVARAQRIKREKHAAAQYFARREQAGHESICTG